MFLGRRKRSRFERLAGYLSGALALVLVAVALFGLARGVDRLGDMPQNPVLAHLARERALPSGTMTNEVPALFSAGEPRSRVVAELEAAGFERSTYWQDSPGGFSDLFTLYAGGNALCWQNFSLYLSFDPATNSLLKASNQVGQDCIIPND